MDFFEPALPDLQASLPAWWQGAQPGGELYTWLVAMGNRIDEVSADAEQLYRDCFLATASTAGLLNEWAYAYGIQHELNSTMTPEVVRGYIEQWIACDGSTHSILNVLLAIISLDPRNQGGPVLTFDAGGAGLTFDPVGAGVGPLYQYTTVPDQTSGFVFPADGSGLTFPDPSLYFDDTGLGLTFDPGGAGITFPSFTPLVFPNATWVLITEDFAHYATTYTVKSYLAFDRSAFQRAIKRFEQAHCTWTYTEVNP